MGGFHGDRAWAFKRGLAGYDSVGQTNGQKETNKETKSSEADTGVYGNLIYEKDGAIHRHGKIGCLVNGVGQTGHMEKHGIRFLPRITHKNGI